MEKNIYIFYHNIIHKLNNYFRHRLSDIQCAKDLTKVSLNGTILGGMCMSEYNNKNSCIGKDFKYRSADGSCNNLKRKYLGKANTPYKRLLFPVYIDGNIFIIFFFFNSNRSGLKYIYLVLLNTIRCAYHSFK